MKSIHHVLDIETTTDKVWDALTTREGLAGWWSTKVDIEDAAKVGEVIDWTFETGTGVPLVPTGG